MHANWLGFTFLLACLLTGFSVNQPAQTVDLAFSLVNLGLKILPIPAFKRDVTYPNSVRELHTYITCVQCKKCNKTFHLGISIAIQPLTATKPWNKPNTWIIIKCEIMKFRVWLNFYVYLERIYGDLGSIMKFILSIWEVHVSFKFNSSAWKCRIIRSIAELI